MIRVLVMILFVMSSFAFAQTDEVPKAVKLDEFKAAPNGYVKMKMDYFYSELNNDPAAQGYIINYGTPKEIAVREKQISDAIKFRRFDSTRITIVNGGFHWVVKTEFWLVPAGAENPRIESLSTKIDEFGIVNSGDIKARLDALYVQLDNNPESQAYIVNFGLPKTILARETQIKNYISMRKLDLSRVKFIKGGASKTVRTEFWIDSKN